jgi:hypothetical protein
MEDDRTAPEAGGKAGTHDRADRFLLEEYRRLASLFQSNEETGERRVSFFVTLTAAVMAAVVTLLTRSSGPASLGLALAGLVILLLLGAMTLVRVVHRNRTTDRYKRGLNMIARHFAPEGSAVLASLLHNPYKAPEARGAGRFFGKGGLMETMVLMNSLVAGAALCVAVVLLAGPGGTAFGVVVALAGLAGAWLVQKAVVRRCYAKWNEEDRAERPKRPS